MRAIVLMWLCIMGGVLSIALLAWRLASVPMKGTIADPALHLLLCAGLAFAGARHFARRARRLR